ncbi:cyanophycin metabolism-associated DUF1854 family protein [Rhodoferax antarcticus]|uniref:DUF1854 domain-containing protein n=1 Tax=Rhodoferax antarcticus ANT.BR TaxID=1111071 RepID=A0A1Q8YC08_9BURK|nr:DUF1854 domain-containing protein [Rhodoferax antarcticus]MCW2312984.1 hypothetical protein [Rhodoferax antarcticus]OLP05584.1 hypothetical protein BLL52_3252 [Rhodoferax antarcticus ANT.BR]
MNASSTLIATPFQLMRNPFGRLVLTTPSGEVVEGVVPVRAFPIQAPEDDISLVHTDGHEVAWIDQLSEVPEPAQSLIRQELQSREFMPTILSIISVTSFSTPCTWRVTTDRGDTSFVLRGDEDIRRVGPTILLVTDSHGIQFLIRDASNLSRESRKILDRFL